jgi:hypothetical protein
MTLDLEVNEVEVKVLTSLASVTEITEWAFDTLACPATSCECERVFGSVKRLLSPDPNALGDDIIEALECLKAWWDNGVVQRR